MSVTTGGKTLDSIVSSGGFEYICSGGVASGTIVSSAGARAAVQQHRKVQRLTASPGQ
ncbi:MAG: hypothetical protein ACLQIQ_03065 [Beijerinckiaceae bacterium]